MNASASNRSYASSLGLDRPAEIVQEYPISTAMIVFGVGMGLGLLLSHTVGDSFLRAVEPPPSMAERLSRQLYETLSQAVPESVARRFASS